MKAGRVVLGGGDLGGETTGRLPWVSGCSNAAEARGYRLPPQPTRITSTAREAMLSERVAVASNLGSYALGRRTSQGVGCVSVRVACSGCYGAVTAQVPQACGCSIAASLSLVAKASIAPDLPAPPTNALADGGKIGWNDPFTSKSRANS